MRKVSSFIIGLVIFIGLPLLAWGLNDITGFINSQARFSYIIMMTILMLLVVLFVPNEGRGSGIGKKSVKEHKLSFLFIQISSLIIVLIAPYCDRHGLAVFGDSELVRYVGLGMTLLGYLLMNWAVIALDKQFSDYITIQNNHKLITTGPYKLIRHPRYLGIIIFLSGISLVFISWFGLIFVLVTIVILIWRIKDEEKLMHDEFKKEWETYKKKSYSIIPYVY